MQRTKRSERPPALRRWLRLQDSPKPTQDLAHTIYRKLYLAARGTMLIAYDIGALLVEARREEGIYGTAATAEIARYTGIAGGIQTVLRYVRLAEAYDREFIDGQVQEPMGNGRFLTPEHFVELADLPMHRQPGMLDRVRAGSMTVAQLRREIDRVLSRPRRR